MIKQSRFLAFFYSALSSSQLAFMASTYCYSLSLPPVPNPPNLHKIQPLPTNLQTPSPFFRSIFTIRGPGIRASNSSYSTAVQDEARKPSEEAMSIDNLCRFVNLNVGNWQGSFFQFDTGGNLLHKVSTKLAASSYGEDELISLIQTLYIKQAPSSTSFSELGDEVEWAEYKIKETNMFTVDKYQQIGFFPNEKAFSLRYQTAGMLETVLRQGVLGEDDTGEESPKNLKLPSRRPAIVCESCLHSLEKDMRVRAFHIMDPKGIIKMILIFLEERGDGAVLPPALDNNVENTDRIVPFLGTWKGHSVTKRSGVYGSTMAEADIVTTLEMDDNGRVIQGITSTSAAGDVTTNVPWTGIKSDSSITFNGGYQMTLLPGGMYMGCPCDVGNNVAESLSFHLEFCWLEGPGKRQRLVRTYDVEGQAVSTTYFYETKM